MASQNLQEFLRHSDPDGTRTKAVVIARRDADGNSPFIIVRDETGHEAVLVPMPYTGDGEDENYLCIDVHSFVGGQDAAAGVFGMTEGRRVSFPVTGSEHQLRSHGWPAARGISVLIGKQEGQDDPDGHGATIRELKAALAHTSVIGSGVNADDDAVIKRAARAYLASISR